MLVLQTGDERLDGDVRVAAKALRHLKAFGGKPIESIVEGDVLTRGGCCRQTGRGSDATQTRIKRSLSKFEGDSGSLSLNKRR